LFDRLASLRRDVFIDSYKYTVKKKLNSIVDNLVKNRKYYVAEVFFCETQPDVNLLVIDFGGFQDVFPGGQDYETITQNKRFWSQIEEELETAEQEPSPHDPTHPSPDPQMPELPLFDKPPVMSPTKEEEETVEIRGTIKSSMIKIVRLLIEEIERKVSYEMNPSAVASRKIKEHFKKMLSETVFVFKIKAKRNSNNSYDIYDIE
jgi:hypothetical protein